MRAFLLYRSLFSGMGLVMAPYLAPRPNLKASLLFASTLILGLPLTVGLNLDALLGIVIVVPLASAVFLHWETGNLNRRVLGIAVRSSIFLATFLGMWIGYIYVLGAGQLGSGDALKIDGHSITFEGFKYLFSQGLGATALVFGAALLASTAAIKGTS